MISAAISSRCSAARRRLGRSRRARSSASACVASACCCRTAADDAEYQARFGGVPAGAGAIGLDHWPQRADRHALGRQCDAVRSHAAELAALAPDVILAQAPGLLALLQVTRTVPIVFPIAGDPVGAGLVDSLARPGGNATGFSISNSV